jgi:hypothetical protein
VEKSPCLNWATQFLMVAYDGACSNCNYCYMGNSQNPLSIHSPHTLLLRLVLAFPQNVYPYCLFVHYIPVLKTSLVSWHIYDVYDILQTDGFLSLNDQCDSLLSNTFRNGPQYYILTDATEI